MVNTILLLLLNIPIILSFLISIFMAGYCLVAVIHFMLTNKYVLISKLDSIFACDSIAYNLWLICSCIMGVTFLLYVFDVLDQKFVYISTGLALYPATWYLIYVGDIWYSTYKEYQYKKSLNVGGK